MQINRLTSDYSVAAQISLNDVADIAAAGFKALINNRPDSEVEQDLHADKFAAEAKKHGLAFSFNPISNQGMTMDNLAAQGKVIAETDGPVFAYCRSGTRSTFCWAFYQAGKIPVNQIVQSAAAAGYDVEKHRAQLEVLAEQN